MTNSRGVVAAARKPRVRIAPHAKHFDLADDAAFLATSYGLTPDPWQFEVLKDWLGTKSPNGRLAASVCGLAMPRQNGKNAVIEMRELYGMVMRGEKILHTAHEVKTARKAFIRLLSFFENQRRYPELVALVKEVRRTNGQEAIVLTNGGSVEFVARSKGSARGFTVDVLVCDEAQELGEEAWEALQPTIAAAPLGNPQIVLTGTPPSEKMNGEVFVRTRAMAATDSKRLAWTDFGLDGPLPDVTDRDLWRACNPALGTRLNMQSVLDEFAMMSAEGFARERLGWWDDPLASGPFPFGAWQALASVESDADGLNASKIEGTPIVALDVSWDRQGCGLAVAGRTADGKLQGELVTPVTVADLADTAAMVVRTNNARGVWLEPASAAGSLIPALRKKGVRIFEVKSGQVSQACGLIYDLVCEGNLVHLNDDVLNAAVGGTRRRNVGDTWRWDRRHGADISPFMAFTFAVWAAAAKKPAGNSRVVVLD